MLLRTLRSEWIKLRRSSIWWLVLLGPVLAILPGFAIADSYLNRDLGRDVNLWISTYSGFAFYYSALFVPLLAGVFATFVCRFEHQQGGWKHLLSLPVPRSAIYWGKLLTVLGLLLLLQTVFLAAVLAGGFLLGINDAVPWKEILTGLLGGWLAAIPIAALQLFASLFWKSFAAPFTLSVVLSLPAFLIGQSATYGPLYPWAQPMRTMIPSDLPYFNAGAFSFFALIVGGGLLAILGGWISFARRDVR